MASATDKSNAEAKPRDYFELSLRVLLRDPLLAVWQVVADIVSYLLRPLALFWVATVLLIGFRTGGLRTLSLGGLAGAIDRMDPIVAIGGLVGLAAAFWLVGLTFEALFSGGIFATLERGLADDEVGGLRLFLERVGVGFPRVAVLEIFAGIAELTVMLLGATVVVALVHLFGPGGLSTAGLLTQTLALAVPSFLFFTLAILVRLTFQVATAPLFVDGNTVGEAIAEGARFLVERFAGIYRLIVFAAGLMLVPLFAYWGIVIVAAVIGPDTPFEPLFNAARIAGQVVIYTSFSVIAVLFHGALFAYYGAESGTLGIPNELASGKDDEGGAEDDGPEERRAGRYDESTRLDELLPERTDRLLDFDDIPGLESDESKD